MLTNRRKPRRELVRIIATAALFLLSALTVAAQENGLPRIVPPLPDGPISPGSTIEIHVQADQSLVVALVAYQPIPAGQVTLDSGQKTVAARPGKSHSLTFAIQIPLRIDPEIYPLTLFSRVSHDTAEPESLGPSTEDSFDPAAVGQPSERITLDIEIPEKPIKISAEPSSIDNIHPGETIPIHLWAAFRRGRPIDLTDSTKTKFQSLVPYVATVDSQGIVKVMSLGRTTVEVTYGAETVRVAVTAASYYAPLAPQHVSGSGGARPNVRSHRQFLLLVLEGLTIAAGTASLIAIH
jgi:hypothetical protein